MEKRSYKQSRPIITTELRNCLRQCGANARDLPTVISMGEMPTYTSSKQDAPVLGKDISEVD